MLQRFPIGVLTALGLLVAACAPLPETAGGPVFLARNWRQVVPLSQPGQFEVIGQPGDWGKAYFCAAADYAQTKLRARNADRVVLVAPVGAAVTRSGTSAIFRVEPYASADTLPASSVTLNMRRSGESRSVATALFLCDDQGVMLH